ncbi:hypothetical protein GW17_00039257 [Ensete ventricosum]|nr:hypothetical protein GW17_00039257 [Ensete ventricosum]
MMEGVLSGVHELPVRLRALGIRLGGRPGGDERTSQGPRSGAKGRREREGDEGKVAVGLVPGKENLPYQFGWSTLMEGNGRAKERQLMERLVHIVVDSNRMPSGSCTLQPASTQHQGGLDSGWWGSPVRSRVYNRRGREGQLSWQSAIRERIAHEAISFGSAGDLVGYDDGLEDLAELLEVAMELLGGTRSSRLGSPAPIGPWVPRWPSRVTAQAVLACTLARAGGTSPCSRISCSALGMQQAEDQ